jgi:hypothetical protein
MYDRMQKKAKDKMKSGFKTCPGCPTPAKCKAAGKCLKGGQEMTQGLYANIHAKRKRIAEGSKEKMRKPGAPVRRQPMLLRRRQKRQ